MMKLPKIILFFLFSGITILLILIHSCGNDNPVVSYDSKTITGFYGFLNNYNSDESILETRLNLDSGYISMGRDTVGADSILNLTLQTPADNVLKPMTEIAGYYGENLSVSDINAMGTNFLGKYFFNNANGNYSGYLTRRNSPPNYYGEGLFEVRHAYCDRNVIVNGTVINIFSIIGPSDTMKYNININFSKGWNPITYYTKTIRAYYSEYDIYNGDPEGSKWFYKDDSQSNFIKK